MSSALHKLRILTVTRLGYGPHATRLLEEAQRAASAKLWASVIILSATIIDVIRHEEQIFDLDQTEDDDEFWVGDGYDYLSAADRKKLDWLRARRNQLVHYEGPVEGMMGRGTDEGQLAADADRAIAALFLILDER